VTALSVFLMELAAEAALE